MAEANTSKAAQTSASVTQSNTAGPSASTSNSAHEFAVPPKPAKPIAKSTSDINPKAKPAAPASKPKDGGSHDGRLHNEVSSSTPSVTAQPRLKDRIGAPIESSDSEVSFDMSDNSSDDNMTLASTMTKRKRVPWSSEEYRAVYSGVKRFGEGKWREIQLHYPELRRRTNVAVKDAYRLILKNPHLVSKNGGR